MTVKIKDIRKGNYISVSWLGDGWHKVFAVEKKGAGKVYLAIENYRGVMLSEDDEVEVQ